MQDFWLQVRGCMSRRKVVNFYLTGPLVEQSLDNVKGVFDTNTFAILRVCKAVVPIMAKRHSGTIVNIGSVVGEMYVVVSWILNSPLLIVN